MSNECMSPPPCAVVPVDDAFGEILVFAVRHAVCRIERPDGEAGDYIARNTTKYVARLIPSLSDRVLRALASEIQDRTFFARRHGYREMMWKSLLSGIHNELRWRSYKAGDRRA